MDGEGQVIKVVGVDKEAIRTASDKKDYWVVPFRLSFKPDQNWEKKFYEVHQKNAHVMKRKAQIAESLMQVEVNSTDNLQKVLDVIKAEILETNTLCSVDYQHKMKIRKDLEELQQKQRDSTQKFKEDSDNLSF
jgi:hypothetical protein